MDYLGDKDQLLTYRVLWSEPTQRKPVPVATASVYFYLLPSSEVGDGRNIIGGMLFVGS